MEINSVKKVNIFYHIRKIWNNTKILKKLDLYIIYSFIIPFFGIFFLTFIIFIVQFFWSQINELSDKDINILIIIKFIFYFGVCTVPLITIISILLTSIITFGELSENRELIIIKSSGISLFRTMLPIFFITMILSIGLYLFSDFIITKAEIKIKELGYKIIYTYPSLKLKERVFNTIGGNFFINIEKKLNNNYFYKVVIFFYDDYSNVNTIHSNKCNIISDNENKFIQLKLINGFLYKESNFNDQEHIPNYYIIRFNTLIKNFKLPSSSFEEIKNINDNDYQHEQTIELIKKIKSLNKKKHHNMNSIHANAIRKKINKMKLEIHRKLTFPITCIIMFFIGASLGALVKKGGIGYPTIIALTIFSLYYIILTIIQNKVEKEEIIPWIGIWIPNFILLLFGIYITHRSMINDS
ncbi:LptF/LptG family permease [Blattabacterium cuenoti]|uniref:LptF/LptG family permease n=1 Tax=Blattabacterium cuenoti TaxID=1653831 RepID=UPI00163C7379|nr:LptF/LptG family permease [Blattabacterium cuenoti]